MIERLRRLLPTPEALAANRWLRWLGPALHHPRLWHMSRRGIALGAAIGVFFGFLVPVAQIPFSAGMAVALRANVPCAIASTLVTNPLTFGPIYYAAWHVGQAVLGEPAQAAPAHPTFTGPQASAVGSAGEGGGGLAGIWQRVTQVGKPLLTGLLLFACGFGAAIYLLINAAWHLRVRLKRRLRLRRVGVAT
jgi:uncharacterized protein (DUF2062 family)